MKTDKQNRTLQIFRERLIGEVRHRIVRRIRDGTYWTTRERHVGGGWVPLEVPNQSGRQTDAEQMFACNTGN